MIFSVLKNYTENRISVIHFWNRFGSVFIKPIPNRLSGFRTSLNKSVLLRYLKEMKYSFRKPTLS